MNIIAIIVNTDIHILDSVNQYLLFDFCLTDVYATGCDASAVSKTKGQRNKIDMSQGVEGWNLS